MISPHGHVDPRLLLDDEPFADPASLFVTPDHYVTRLLHASGVASATRSASGRARSTRRASREAWRALCAHWDVFRGTPVRFWLEAELAEIFGVDGAAVRARPPTRSTTRSPTASPSGAYRPRALFERFRHRGARHDRRSVRRPRRARGARGGPDVVGSGDPDVPSRPLPRAGAARAGAHAVATARRGRPTSTPATTPGFVAALEARRRYFLAHGATSADHSHEDVRTDPLEPAEAARIYRAALAGEATAAEAVAFRRHMLLEMARMSSDDGLVMTLHPGVRRSHHGPTRRRVRPGHRPRHPARASSSPTRCARCSSASARTRTSTWSCSRSTRPCGRASSRRWPASTRRSTSARRGGSSTRRTRSGASARR